jgi:hypothetical protein
MRIFNTHHAVKTIALNLHVKNIPGIGGWQNDASLLVNRGCHGIIVPPASIPVKPDFAGECSP